jgi:hypothetical protein
MLDTIIIPFPVLVKRGREIFFEKAPLASPKLSKRGVGEVSPLGDGRGKA